jgi:hypothetical protein
MKTALFVLAVAIACAGCGNNLAGPAGTPLLGPPGGLAALSVDSAHVSVIWTPPSDVTDTSFAGYVLAWGTVADTLPKTAVQFTAGPLSRGATAFSIRSRLKNGQTSDAAVITWAPAWRFDAVPIIVTEYNSAQQTGVPGVDAGTSTTNPATVGLLDANADSTLDFYLWGPANSPLQLLSASQYDPGWHQTLFSTATTPSQDLNASLASFPPDNTFTLQSVTLADNVIYYVKVQGNTGEINYARVHVHLLPGGTFPSRQVDIRISLQRVSRLPYA